MRRTRRSLWLFTLILLLLAAPGHGAANSRPECRVCGMWIDQYPQTRHVLTAKDGTVVMFCSLTCAAKYLRSHPPEARERLQVADYLTTKLVDTRQAVYLVGSDAPPVMSNTSIIAFASRRQAKKFQHQHGGRFLTFRQALAVE